MKLTLSILTMLTVAIAGTSHANISPGWKTESFTQKVDQKASVTGDFVYSGVILETTDTTGPTLRFGCSERYGLTATVTFFSKEDLPKDPDVRFKFKNTSLKIEGRDTELVNWVHVRATRTLQTRDQKHASMIYNAIIQDKAMTINEPFKGRSTLKFPKPDTQFRDFHKTCHVTTPKDE